MFKGLVIICLSGCSRENGNEEYPSAVLDWVPTAYSVSFSSNDSRCSCITSLYRTSSGVGSSSIGRPLEHEALTLAMLVPPAIQAISHIQMLKQKHRTVSSSLYPNLPLSTCALTISHALLCLFTAFVFFHPCRHISCPSHTERRIHHALIARTSSSENVVVSISSLPATRSRN